MSSHDFESFSDGEWDNSEELAWNEFDWQQYLKSNEQEIASFLSHYHQLKTQSDHLDEIARLMGWESEDWSALDPEETEEAAIFNEEGREALDDDFDPYTVHKHPVYIVTHGLYQHLFKCWELFTAHNIRVINPIHVVQFASSLHAGELNAIMAINALDMGDYNLAICHLKNALSAVNHSFSLLQQLNAPTLKDIAPFTHEVTIALFDLREVWLRIMSDCREEGRRNNG